MSMGVFGYQFRWLQSPIFVSGQIYLLSEHPLARDACCVSYLLLATCCGAASCLSHFISEPLPYSVFCVEFNLRYYIHFQIQISQIHFEVKQISLHSTASSCQSWTCLISYRLCLFPVCCLHCAVRVKSCEEVVSRGFMNVAKISNIGNHFLSQPSITCWHAQTLAYQIKGRPAVRWSVNSRPLQRCKHKQYFKDVNKNNTLTYRIKGRRALRWSVGETIDRCM